jgi:hypothetical protein
MLLCVAIPLGNPARQLAYGLDGPGGGKRDPETRGHVVRGVGAIRLARSEDQRVG